MFPELRGDIQKGTRWLADVGKKVAAHIRPQPVTVSDLSKFLTDQGMHPDTAVYIARTLINLKVLPMMHSSATDQRLNRQQNQQLWMRKLITVWPKQQISPQGVSPREQVGEIAQMLAQLDITTGYHT